MSIGQQLLDVPFGEMISSLGIAIAQAQQALDTNSINILKQMGEKDTVSLPFCTVEYKDNKVIIEDKPLETSMIGAGFQPTFYQFAETIIEVKIAINMSYEREYGVKSSVEASTKDARRSKKEAKKPIARTTTVDASYSSKYNYSAEGSSLLRTRLVPVPPNTTIADIIEMRSSAMQLAFDLERTKIEGEIAIAQAQAESEIANITVQNQTNLNNKLDELEKAKAK